MLEILLGIGVCISMAKIADADDQSATIWFCVTFALCVLSALVIPLPFIRFMIAGAAAFGLMIGYKVVAKA